MRAIAADYLTPLPDPQKGMLADLVETFLEELTGRNRSRHTIDAYRRDLGQFLSYLLTSA